MGPEVCFDENNQAYIPVGEYRLQLEMEELSDEYLAKAEKDLRETPEIKAEALASLRNLLSDEPGLNVPLDDDNYLLKFLRPCKFYPESAFRLMRRYYKFKLKYPKYSDHLVPSALKSVVSESIASFLPVRDNTGCRIMILRIGSRWDPKSVKLADLFRAIMMFIEIGMAEPKTQLAGVQVVIDMQGLSLNQVYQFGPSFARAVLEWVQECIPLRLKGVHIVNEPKIFNLLFMIFKPFINDKLRKRLFFHGTTYTKIQEAIGINCLPTCYGGSLDIAEVPGEVFYEILVLHESEFQKTDTLGYSKDKMILDN